MIGLFIGHSASQLYSGFSERMRELSCPLLAFESAVSGGGDISESCCPELSSRAVRVGQSKDTAVDGGVMATHKHTILPYVAIRLFCLLHNLVEWLTSTLVQLLTHISRSSARPTSKRASKLLITEDNFKISK